MEWVDARDLIRTDGNYREASVDWDSTAQNIQAIVPPIMKNNKAIITQGFIGSTAENNTTTLGREGSDYSAAILSYCLEAEKMMIWKDVPGILTADPKLFENVSKIDRLSYKEAIEMTYYGAKVIHPKTIKPLQNKNIPLYVKSFVKPNSAGTLIFSDIETIYPPVVVVEKNQALLHISTKDFSFVAEHHLSKIFEKFAQAKIKINLMRNTAISFTVCILNQARRIDKFLSEISDEFIIYSNHY